MWKWGTCECYPKGPIPVFDKHSFKEEPDSSRQEDISSVREDYDSGIGVQYHDSLDGSGMCFQA